MTADDVPEELLQNDKRTTGTFEVYSENITAVNLFLICETQFQYREWFITGFNYAGVEAAIRLSGITCTPDDFHRLRVLEIEAASAINQRLKQLSP